MDSRHDRASQRAGTGFVFFQKKAAGLARPCLPITPGKAENRVHPLEGEFHRKATKNEHTIKNIAVTEADIF